VAFFGDHYLSDVSSSAKCSKSEGVIWHAIAVIEELALIDPTLDMGIPADHVLTTSKWGSNYFYEESIDG